MPPIDPSVRSVLDVGCGAGQTLIASRLAPGVTAVGIDPDSSALALGRRLGAPVHLVQARGERLPFAAESFDMVFSRVALPYMRLRTSLPEMSRVLRPGGKLWFLLHPLSHVMRELAEHASAGHVRATLHRLYVIFNGTMVATAGLEMPSPASGKYESFQTSWGVCRELRRLGFEQFAADRGRGHFVFRAVKVGGSRAAPSNPGPRPTSGKPGSRPAHA
jgi:SAM-dependent methyltransferase